MSRRGQLLLLVTFGVLAASSTLAYMSGYQCAPCRPPATLPQPGSGVTQELDAQFAGSSDRRVAAEFETELTDSSERQLDLDTRLEASLAEIDRLKQKMEELTKERTTLMERVRTASANLQRCKSRAELAAQERCANDQRPAMQPATVDESAAKAAASTFLNQTSVILMASKPEIASAGATADPVANILILTPLKNAELHIESYLSKLDRLDYPKTHISIGLLVSDSQDGTFDLVQSLLPELQSKYRSVRLVRKDFNFRLGQQERHEYVVQPHRRAILAQSRNILLATCLRDERWVLWLDSDLHFFPSNLIQQLLQPEKPIVVANVVLALGGGVYDLNSWQQTPESLAYEEKLPRDQLLLEGYETSMSPPRGINFFRDNPDFGDGQATVELDAVGAGALLVHADLHRYGLNFPSYPFRHRIESEGLGQMAVAMGYRPHGLPHLEVVHL
ncbi:hypothetical protein CAOG_06684 [Capsaspora owczarzaki ATCC 30864]|uniref:Uncharacterized protein n=1 Tax=Capsaspora owczarzaki (strain ATCC 30864) TaxID=595528 RepID=A0A0D2X4N0_CAPO3|nr:hypothetical protein CAOG_06684 [Capsaspora owczarzaki ATCC 30864]KJE96344.1 hypothetical protein CAOG_006684 [Capsaspora owczarzaki ATCC 30864]|eukprot:XP_004344305.2 hypothetical protein CAOG_06684 [Capsaspora owczarzaki ATCC 30864]